MTYEQLHFFIHPNPADDVVIINTQGLIGEKYYRLMDISGRLIQNGVFTSEEERIDLRNLSEGLYFLELIHKGNRSVQKLVVE